MKMWSFGALSLTITLQAGAALACPVGNGDRPVRRPVVQNVSLAASELFARAQHFETDAATRERQALAFERDAETLANRARLLRNQAQLVSFADRSDVLAIADDLSARASATRSQAGEERSSAADLRLRARSLRERALQLVRGRSGGGWHGKPVPNAPRRAETSI